MDFAIRKIRKAQGPVKLQAEREEYFRLVQMGLTKKQASRRVGVHERTGREWRNGRRPASVRAIAAELGRSPSTISREIRAAPPGRFISFAKQAVAAALYENTAWPAPARPSIRRGRSPPVR